MRRISLDSKQKTKRDSSRKIGAQNDGLPVVPQPGKPSTQETYSLLTRRFISLVKNAEWPQTSCGVKPMSEKDLIAAIDRKYKEMPRKKRMAIIREFANRSAADKRFFRRYFPELFNEAFPISPAGARTGSARRRARHAPPR